MEENKNILQTFIAFLDDDNRKKEEWIIVLENNSSYVKFEYKGKIISIPWHRILKLKEDGDSGD